MTDRGCERSCRLVTLHRDEIDTHPCPMQTLFPLFHPDYDATTTETTTFLTTVTPTYLRRKYFYSRKNGIKNWKKILKFYKIDIKFYTKKLIFFT